MKRWERDLLIVVGLGFPFTLMILLGAITYQLWAAQPTKQQPVRMHVEQLDHSLERSSLRAMADIVHQRANGWIVDTEPLTDQARDVTLYRDIAVKTVGIAEEYLAWAAQQPEWLRDRSVESRMQAFKLKVERKFLEVE